MVVDRHTGEVRPVELFVAVLGASSFTYAEATATQQLPDWVGAHTRMVECFGGSTGLWVPDQLKSAITRSCRYEPGINRTYEELAAHYGAVVVPARPRKPRDKAAVENGVLIAQRWILARLRHQTFFSLDALNRAIRTLLDALNDRPMQQLGVSRRVRYAQLDRPALRPLPAARYVLAQWTPCRVNIDYHVQVARHPYSVPYQLIHELVEARSTTTTVELYYKGRRITSHRRRYDGQPSTKPEHMPRAHRAHAEWTPSRLIRWAEQTGPATGRLVVEILRSRPHPEQGYRACLGIMRLGRRYGDARLEAASARALRGPRFDWAWARCRAPRDRPGVLPSPAARLPGVLQRLPHRAPILCGRFHHHFLDLLRHQPRRQVPEFAGAGAHAPVSKLIGPFHGDVRDHDREHPLVHVNPGYSVRHRPLLAAGAERVPVTSLFRLSGSRRSPVGHGDAHSFAQHAHAGSSN